MFKIWDGGSWVEDGQIAGTTGKSRRLEAIKIKLENTEEYSVMYSGHVEDYGWQDWVKDGETAGTVGIGKRLEAIKIKIVNKATEEKYIIRLEDLPENVSNEVHSVSGWAMTNVKNTKIELLVDDKLVDSKIERNKDQDIINNIKGYGGEELNPTPRFITKIDFSNYSLGEHKITVRLISEKEKILSEDSKKINIKEKIESKIGTYGISGLKANGDSSGSDLRYYKYGSGPNVFFATFSVHGFEDHWDKDGTELVNIADKFYETLKANSDFNLAEKWTIYIFPEVNPDGRRYGYTKDGPGRTTLFSNAPENKGIDLNRCWSVDFKFESRNRNYTGTEPFQACEAKYLRDFLLQHKSQNDQTILVDLHGWTQQLIGDPLIRDFYRKQFSENTDTPTYGKGYLINWARVNLGSSKKAARSALIELPSYINNSQDVINNNLTNRYITATLDMLKGIN